MTEVKASGLSGWFALTVGSLESLWGTEAKPIWRSPAGGLRLVRRSRRYVRFVSATDGVFIGSTEPKTTFRFGGLRLRRVTGAAK